MEDNALSVSIGINDFIEKARRYLQPGEKPPKGVRIQTGKRGAKFYDTSPRRPKKSDPKAMKGKWMNRKPKVPVFVAIDVKETKGKHRKQRPYSVKSRTQWITLDKALKGGYEVNFEELNTDLHSANPKSGNANLYEPEDTRRLHEHDGMKVEHPVSKKHTGEKAKEAHDAEKEKYSDIYATFKTKKTPEERKIRQRIAAKTEKLEKIIKKKYPKAKDKRKVDTLIHEINKTKEELKKKCNIEILPTKKKPKKKGDKSAKIEIENVPTQQDPTWMDKFGVGRIIDQTVEFKGKSYKADVFTSPDTKNALYLFEVPERNYENPENEYMEAKKAPIKVPYRVYVGTDKKGVTSFDTMGKAMQAVELVFTREDLKERILMKQLDLQKKMILNKVEELINSPSGALPVEDMSDGFKVFSNFQSGDDKVTLEGDEKQYKVCTNGIPSVVTEDFREALAKYYSSVSRIVDTQNEDKDIGLELFGEHVLNTSRNTRRMMADLDRGMEAKMLSELDYSEISLPFNPEFILKYDPQGDFERKKEYIVKSLNNGKFEVFYND